MERITKQIKESTLKEWIVSIVCVLMVVSAILLAELGG